MDGAPRPVTLGMVRGPLGYKDVELIGVGATSRVYRATQSIGNRVVALKRLHRQLVQSSDALARLRRELEALGKLEHPAIVRFHDVVHWDGDPTIVMEHVPGHDLKALVEAQGTLPIAEVERIARVLLAALSVVHAGGIVHRDLKPQNVRVRDDGQVILLDFGSARLDAASQLTRTGSTVGTPEYMPPELFVGPAYDPRSDVYGAGATLFECLTGRAPHTADTLAELAYLRSEVPAPPVQSLRPEVPLALAQVVDRCLAIRPEERFPTAALAAWALDHGEEERMLAARRSRRPLCVHCGQACAPEAGQCARCGSVRPFRFDPGPHHVVIDSVGSAEKLVRWIADVVPERSGGLQRTRTCQQVAAVGFEEQRLISLVSEADAHATVKSLALADVQAHVQRAGQGVRGLAGVGLAAGVFFGGSSPASWLGLGAAALGIPLLAARRDVLAWTALPQSPSAGPQHAVVAGLILAAVGLASAIPGFVDALTFGGAYALGVGAVLLYGVLGSLLGARAVPRSPGPETSGRERVGALFRSVKSRKSGEDGASAAAQPVKLHPLLMFTVVLSTLALIPLELRGIVSVLEGLSPPGHRVQLDGIDLTGPVVIGPAQRRPVVTVPVGSAASAPADPSAPLGPSVPGSSPPGSSPSPVVRTANTTQSPALPPSPARTATRLAVGWLTPLLMLIALARHLRRVRRIRRDARTLEAAVMRDERRRLVPRRTERTVTAGALLAHGQSGDPFVDGAVQRAADLVALVEPQSIDRVVRALEPLRLEAGTSTSLLAQCVLETDASYALRFQLLELEGELEAEAARTWAEKLQR